MIVFLFFLIFSLNFQQFAGQDECEPTSCTSSGPIIRFPFRLTGRQPEHCGYPGFDLSCNPKTNTTEFNFPFPVSATSRNIILPMSAKATVQQIDYSSQVVRVRVVNGSCLPNRVPDVSSPSSPFELRYSSSYDPWTLGYTLFNCSGKLANAVRASGPIDCLRYGNFEVYAYSSSYTLGDLSVSNCVKMYNVSDIRGIVFNGEYSEDTRLHWSKPSCGNCEANGQYCRLKSNGTDNETECVDIPKQPAPLKKKGVSKKLVIAVVIVGVFLILLAFAALLYIYNMKSRKQKNEKRIQQFLEDYKALRPTRYKYSDIKRITDNFKHKLGQGGYGTVYKGKLSTDIPVAVKILNNIKGNGEEFINEVATIGKIHHVNVVRLVGYCADGYRRALVYEFLENDSLEKYISHSRRLGWEKLHAVAIGIAKGLDYLHQGCNQRILHFDIKPHNILLDHNLNPKVADFGLAKLCSKEQSVVTMTAARGTIGYIAPEVFSRNFGKVSYKSDIYSYGMVLLDMVGGRKSFKAAEGQDSSSQVYFPEWMYNQLDKGEDLAIEIEKEEESDLVKRLIIVGLWCIQWYPADRPSTKVVIQMLEGENMPVMPPNPFTGSTPVKTNSTSTSSGSSAFSSSTSTSTN